MNGLEDRWTGCTQGTCKSKLSDHFRNIGSDQMRSKQLAVLGIKHELDKALGLANAMCFAVGSEWELATLTSWPASLAFRSVRPMLATCGWQ